MTIGVAGLGLIGGSVAKAYKKAGHKVLAYDIDTIITDYSMLDGTVDGVLTEDNIGECELVLIALYPKATVEYLESIAPHINKNTVVMDLCGTKKSVCEKGFELSKKYGFSFAGGHPMAGTHNSGYKYSFAELFKGAPMVIVPHTFDDMAYLDKLKKMLEPLEFGFITAADAKRHDEIIAFTSQLAHIVSNAYIKSPTALAHSGFSAGSYKDLTRVAWLNPKMWAQLFMENKENILFELNTITYNLEQYKNAIESNDIQKLETLLEQGRKLKEEVDGK